jgi:hypothetical protein
MAECPHLEYRDASGEQSFDVPRAYCAVADEFVEPMRADICHARYGLEPSEDCEIYIAHEAGGAEADP